MADAKTPIVRQMSVAPTTSAPSQSTGTGNSGPSGSGSDHTKTPQVRTIFSWKPTLENGLHVYAASPAFQWAAKSDPFFLGSTQFGTQFLGSNWSGWPSGSLNGSNWVGLILKRVQMWVRPYNVLNKPNLNPGRALSFRLIGLSRVGFALSVKIRFGLVGFIWPH